MIETLLKKTHSGDLYINLAHQYLNQHEWGRARTAAEQGIRMGQLSDPDQAQSLLVDICQRMGIRKTIK